MSEKLLHAILFRKLGLTMESFSVVVNLARISPRFIDQGSKSAPSGSSSLTLFFLPRSWKHKISSHFKMNRMLTGSLLFVSPFLLDQLVNWPLWSCCETWPTARWKRPRRTWTGGLYRPAWSWVGPRVLRRTRRRTRRCCLYGFHDGSLCL